MRTEVTTMTRLHRRIAGPTPLTLRELVTLTRTVAADVGAGRHRVEFDSRDRWSVRLSGDDYADVWLISWTPSQSTELHDHAGSLGALTVVDGTLTEYYWAAADHGSRRLRRHELATLRSAAFPVGHVHDVVNTSAAPAVSVHAYSPPLTVMSYYDVDPRGALRRTRSVLTDEPEPGTTRPVPATAPVG
jgi:predicted metal-dependent enzyme (double-stranded beta helix superfamily)